MKRYLDAFVITMPKKNMKAYQKMASLGGRIWKKCGALQYVETVGHDLKGMPGCMTFKQLAKPKANETVVFSWILYKNKAHRDAVNKKVMADPEMNEPPEGMPFDMKKMAVGGFEVIVDM